GFGGGMGNIGAPGLPGLGSFVPGGGGGGGGLGGAIFNEAGTVSIINSTLVDNTAQGGFSLNGNGGDGDGGAVFNLEGDLSVRYSTLANNVVISGNGGNGGNKAGSAIYNLKRSVHTSPAAASGTTLSLSVESSIIAGAAADMCHLWASHPISPHQNIVQHPGNCGLNQSSKALDPLLGPLSNYGGPTDVMLPQLGSPAIDGTACQWTQQQPGYPFADAPSTDQRGVLRPQGMACDIGAAEVIASSGAVTQLDDSHEFARYGSTLNYVFTLHNASGSALIHATIHSQVPQQIDVTAMSWQCFASQGSTCIHDGTGALEDSNVQLAAHSTMTWYISAPVKPDAIGSTLSMDVSVDSLLHQPYQLSDTDTLVIFRDGFDPEMTAGNTETPP
ncbi:MAG: hypothetical protein L0H70_10150, partial [Xanthomonadales bacterium]|nr:hypothetical protein [Xanthomonadales bacterium]